MKSKIKSKRIVIPPGLRHDVLARDKFRCQYCGVSAKEARLEIDHKIPVSLGGKTELKNLQVLCRACNRGKAAKYKKPKVKKIKPKRLLNREKSNRQSKL